MLLKLWIKNSEKFVFKIWLYYNGPAILFFFEVCLIILFFSRLLEIKNLRDQRVNFNIRGERNII